MKKKYECAHDAITFQLLEMSSITTPKSETIWNIRTMYIFKGFLEKILTILRSFIMKKINLEVIVTETRVNVYQIS